MKLNNLLIKYLQYFYKKQNSEKGNLGELLVVCIIVGVLASVTFSYVQFAIIKSRSTECIAKIGKELRIKQGDYPQNQSFPTTLSSSSNNNNYYINYLTSNPNPAIEYNIELSNPNATTTGFNTLPCSGRIVFDPSTSKYNKIICQGNNYIAVTIGFPTGNGNSLTCPANSIPIG